MNCKYEFCLPDGSNVELDCDQRFLDIVRDRFQLTEDEEVTSQHVKRMFLDSIVGALEEA